jgi:hypothetical protein
MKAMVTKLEDFPAWELEAYADGEPISHIATFVQEHPTQWQQWLQQNQLSQQLASALYRFDCPAVETLRAYLWGELTGAEQQQADQHLAICPHCTEELASLRAFMAKNSSSPALQSTPGGQQPGWLEQIQSLVAQMRLVVAQLVTPLPQFAGVALRSADPLPLGQGTTILFEAENTDISLTLQKERNETFTLAGQIFVDELAKMKAAIRLAAGHTNTEILISDIPETGSFVVRSVPPGDYQMVIVLPHQAIVIPHLELH